MAIKIALAGNPNCGKTTMFNDLTGSNQFVGNWPGVTVEKKEGRLKGHPDVVVTDLPGIYSLSPYTLEEVVTRDYLMHEHPDVILNLVDASNIERNLYLTTQLVEMGIPVVVALNMMDIVRKNGDSIDVAGLSQALNCPVVEMSALKGQGTREAADRAIQAVAGAHRTALHSFGARAEGALGDISGQIAGLVPAETARWYAVKLFERDRKIARDCAPSAEILHRIEEITAACEKDMDDDSESIVTNERYEFIAGVVKRCVRKKRSGLTMSDRIDQIVTNRVLALPIFAAVMFLVYYLSVTTIGAIGTDWANDGVFGAGWNLFGWEIPGVPVLVGSVLTAMGVSGWLSSLILDGIIGGVGAVLGFVPQMLVLFLMLCVLEDCGYMARVAFIMDRVFRRFGLSGKSFIPMLIASGCGIPGVMASRTIEQDRDRKMTIMTTTFIPCGAKLPIVAMIAGAMFGGVWWVAPSAYFIGVAAVVVSGIILKKTKAFAGEAAPFVMELPQYHVPAVGNVLRGTWERGWSFIKKAGTIILLASIFVWFASSFGFVDGAFGMVEELDASIIAVVGSAICGIFAPLGFATWESTVATLLGLVAKEEVVGVFGTLYAVGGDALAMVEAGAFDQLGNIAAHFTPLSAYSFLIFNLLCAPCFAAIGAIKREMNSPGWTWFAIGYQTTLAYTVSLIFYQIGLFASGNGFGFWTAVALALLGIYIWLLTRRGYIGEEKPARVRAVDVAIPEGK